MKRRTKRESGDSHTQFREKGKKGGGGGRGEVLSNPMGQRPPKDEVVGEKGRIGTRCLAERGGGKKGGGEASARSSTPRLRQRDRLDQPEGRGGGKRRKGDEGWPLFTESGPSKEQEEEREKARREF